MDDTDNQIHYPSGFRFCEILEWGSFGMVLRKPGSRIVVKSPHFDAYQKFIDIERLIYERIEERNGHPGILRYHGTYESAIQLEFAARGTLRSCLARDSPPIEPTQRRRWALEIAQSLDFIHRVGVIHGDLSSANILLAEDGSAKLADFSGSSLDGSLLLVHAGASYAHPVFAGSQKGDMFAYGSLVYELFTGSAPFANLEDQEIKDHFARNHFPETKALGSLNSIVRKCWLGQYSDTSELVRHTQRVLDSQKSLINSLEAFSPSQIAYTILCVSIVGASLHFISRASRSFG